MLKLIAWYLGLSLVVGIGGSIYDSTRQMAALAKHAYQSDQISYLKFTKVMTAPKSSKAL